MTYIVTLKDRFGNSRNKTITLNKADIDLFPNVNKDGYHNEAILHRVYNDYPDTAFCKIIKV